MLLCHAHVDILRCGWRSPDRLPDLLLCPAVGDDWGLPRSGLIFARLVRAFDASHLFARRFVKKRVSLRNGLVLAGVAGGEWRRTLGSY